MMNRSRFLPTLTGDRQRGHGARTKRVRSARASSRYDKGEVMSDLIAIGYDDTTTALKAMDEVERLAGDLVIQPDAVAAIIRTPDGKFRTVTNQHHVGGGATWGMFW